MVNAENASLLPQALPGRFLDPELPYHVSPRDASAGLCVFSPMPFPPFGPKLA
jgi:hypothetical protein